MDKYDEIYEKIKDAAIELSFICSPLINQEFDEYREETKEMFRDLLDLLNKATDKAHLLNEHLTWDYPKK